MAEEQENGGTSLKSILIGLVSTITIAVGGFITNKLTGGDDKETPAAVAPVINIQNNQTQSAGGGKTVIIKEKATDAKPAAPTKKKEGDEFKEKPAQG